MISALVLSLLAACGTEKAAEPAPQLPTSGVFALGFRNLPVGFVATPTTVTAPAVDPLSPQTVWCESARCTKPGGFVRTNATGTAGVELAAIVEYLNLDEYQQRAAKAASGARQKKLWGVTADIVTTNPTKKTPNAQRSIVWGIGQRRFRLIATAPTRAALPTENVLISIAKELRPEALQHHIAIRLTRETLTVGAQQRDYELMYSNEDGCIFVQDAIRNEARASGRCNIDFTKPGYSTASLPVRGGGMGTLVYGWAGPNDTPTVIGGDSTGAPTAITPKYVEVDRHIFFIAAIPASQLLYGAQNSDPAVPLVRDWNGPNLNDFPWITKGSEAQSPVNLPYTALQTLGIYQIFGLNSPATYEGSTQELFCIVAQQNVELIGTVQAGVLPLCTPATKASAAITPDGTTVLAVIGAEKDVSALLPMLMSPTSAQIKFPKSPQVVLMQPLVEGACVHAELFDAFVDNGHSDRRCAPSGASE